MDWLLATPQLHSAFSGLGSFEGDNYVVNPNALATLEEINYKLTYEDKTLRTFRRAIGFGQNIRIDLIPLLANAKDQDVLAAVMRILVNLTVPVECLFSVEVMVRTDVGRHTIFELNKLLYTSKEAFTEAKSTKAVVEYMKHILESDSKLSLQNCDQINNCLLLLRNILHIPEAIVAPSTSSLNSLCMQNSIIWNLFIQSIDKLLIYLMTCPQRAFWGATMVQLIALMYKDQHVHTLQKLLNLWFEASMSESSEDNESNTSPLKEGSGDSSPMLTSDPTSDSSDNGGNFKGVGCEERRQALRDETEATLQEVSRKGKEYQDLQDFKNAIKNLPAAEKYEETNTTAAAEDIVEASNTSSTSAADEIENDKSKDMETNANEHDEDAKSDESLMQTNGSRSDTPTQQQKFTENIQPANISSHTTNQEDLPNNNNSGEDEVMPPPDTPPKQHQKVPHAGQLNLTRGKSCPQKRECPSSQSEQSDCGYGTQVENQESISTSSNDDDSPQHNLQHQKPQFNQKARTKQRPALTMLDKKELRRKKLVRRSKNSLINVKGFVQHTPSDEDISHILKDFTVDFLFKAYGHLVEELHNQLLTNLKRPFDTSHFFWIVTYFLKFAAQLELDMEHISSVLTHDVISYLTYEGVTLCEQLDWHARHEDSDLKTFLRRLHLVVTAIREFLQAIETYKKITHLTHEDREHLQRLQVQISDTEDLRCLFVLLLRRYNPSLHSKQYLQDLILTNHLLLVIMDSVRKSEDSGNIKMMEHIAQFANTEIMHSYGTLLENFDSNGEYVNDCIFTMLHHVGGDLGQISTLFQPIILKTFSRIWETEYELCDDWSDLIEYVIHKFMNTPQKNTLSLPSTSLTELTKEHNLEHSVCTWTKDEMDTLYWYYVQSKKETDVVGKVLSQFVNNGKGQKSRISIINQLLQQDIITLVEYDDLMKFEDAEYQQTLSTSTPTSSESGIEQNSSSSTQKPSDDIEILRDFVTKENKQQHIIWLQKILIECCYIKLTLRKFPLRENRQSLEFVMEPVAYHCIMNNSPIPVVQWNTDQAMMMLNQPFVLLLHKLGIQLPADAGTVFARIPDDWTPLTMYELAKKLGSLDKLFLKFDEKDLGQRPTSTGTAAFSRTSTPVNFTCLQTKMTESHETSLSGGGFNSGKLSPIAEIETRHEKSHEIFAVPKAKHCNSIIRLTPDPYPVSPVPNWLQLVMRSKCTAANQSPSAAAAMLTMNQRVETDVSMLNSCGSDNNPVTLASRLIGAKALLQDLTELTTETKADSTLLATIVERPETEEIKYPQNRPQVTTTSTLTRPITSAVEAISCASIIGLNEEQIMQKVRKFNDSFTPAADKTYSNEPNRYEGILKTIVPLSLTRTNSTETATSSAMSSLVDEITETAPNDLEMKQQFQTVSDDDDLMTRSYKQSDRVWESLDSEFSTMIADAYKNEVANSKAASVASDLTRMYVSDEEERPEIPITPIF